MELTFESVLEAFDAALELVEDEEQQQRLQRVIQASRASVERATQDLVASVVDEVNSDLGGRAHVDLRYTAHGLDLSVVANAPAGDGEDDEAWQYADSEVEKVTLRVPVELKDRASRAAKESGISVNAWFIRLLARELREPRADSEGREDRREGRGRKRRGHRPGQGGGSLKGWIGQ